MGHRRDARTAGGRRTSRRDRRRARHHHGRIHHRPDPFTRHPQEALMTWLHFDIHGRAGIRVAADAPTARQLRTMLQCFATGDEVPDDIVVTRHGPPRPEAAWLEHEFRYTDTAVAFRAERVEVERRPDGKWQISGPGELLTTLVPIIDRCLVTRGVAMIHAATVAYRDVGIALPAAGGTGKTSVIAKLIRRPDFAFMGDDWAFLDDNGNLLG